jgi:multidrug efflux pump subunit AcrB
LRKTLPREFPDTVFSFPPADIVSQILNFGAPAPIDIQIRGANLAGNFEYANKLLKEIRRIPGVADARIQQSSKSPVFDVNMDRGQAQDLGITPKDVTNNLVVNLAGSSQVAPTFWLNPVNGISYSVVMQAPQYKLDSLSDLANLPVSSGGVNNQQLLGGIASFNRTTRNAVVSQYDIQPLVQINATTQDTDLGSVAKEVRRLIAETEADLPKGTKVVLLGQVRTMEKAFSGLLWGLLAAVVLIYFLIVVNFQSWRDPFVIVSALPAALAGIVWMLFATRTTLSVPALTGAIMCMGVATANSVLVISFARERLEEWGDPMAAALDAGFVRFRPVLMTALAMVIGMIPMALGLGEGGEQNAASGPCCDWWFVFCHCRHFGHRPSCFQSGSQQAWSIFALPLVFRSQACLSHPPDRVTQSFMDRSGVSGWCGCLRGLQRCQFTRNRCCASERTRTGAIGGDGDGYIAHAGQRHTNARTTRPH